MRRTLQALSLLCLAVLQCGASGDYIRVILESPSASPFRVVRYEVIDRGPAVSVVHRRTLPDVLESLHSMGLLTKQEATQLRDVVRETKALELPDAVPPKPTADAMTWKVDLELGGKRHSFRVTDPINQADRRYYRLLDAVRTTVRRVAGELPFRNIFFPKKELGLLDVVSVPVARVLVDGFDTKLDSPLFGYEIRAGQHEVRLKTPDGRLDRTYLVKVTPGGSTRLAVDLR